MYGGEEMPIIGATLTTCEPLKPIYREYAECFEQLLRISTYPLAVKMAEKEEDIPKLAKRPLRDFGHHMYTCQCFAISRRNGEMVAQKKQVPYLLNFEWGNKLSGILRRADVSHGVMF